MAWLLAPSLPYKPSAVKQSHPTLLCLGMLVMIVITRISLVSIEQEGLSYVCVLYMPFLILKAKHLDSSAFCNFHRLEVSEQALGGIPLGFRIVVWKISHSEIVRVC